MVQFRAAPPQRVIAAVAMTGLLALAPACGSAGSNEDGVGAEGVPFGASMDEYHAAFSDVEPVTLRFQVGTPQGDPANDAKEAYAAAVEEWSDGKISFEFGYSNAFVPEATEFANGLADGRMDLAYIQPYLTAEVFPALSALANASFLDGNQPTSTLVSSAWTSEIAYSSAEFSEEAADAGIQLLVAPPTFNVAGYFCPESSNTLEELSGLQISAAGAGQFAQIEALNATPVSMAFTELYEALQRGVVDCTATATTVLDTLGAVELVPHLVADTESGLADFFTFFAMSDLTWSSLPLVAQQLLFDRMDVLMQEEPVAQSGRNQEWIQTAVDLGGGVVALDSAASDALAEAESEILEGLHDRGMNTDDFLEAHERWSQVLTDDLYASLPVSMEEFLLDGGYTDVDLTAFTEALYSEVLVEYRPG